MIGPEDFDKNVVPIKPEDVSEDDLEGLADAVEAQETEAAEGDEGEASSVLEEMTLRDDEVTEEGEDYKKAA